MLNKESVVFWNSIERDLYKEDGHIFGVELDLFNNHKYFYHRKGNTYIYLSNDNEDICEAIDEFNKILEERKL